MKMAKMAILVDGGFYKVKIRNINGNQKLTPQELATELVNYCNKHVEASNKESGREHYRTFYYDCPPIQTTVYNPITKQTEDIGKSATFTRLKAFLKELTLKDKLALRLGRLNASHIQYILKPRAQQALFEGRKTVEQLVREDLKLDIGQKGVDMRLGLDLVSLALKRLVDQVVLITGDSDFVPAIKIARTEGVEVILDPMGHHITEDLQEHIDRIRTVSIGSPTTT
jgi:uncharacterized LabA/DUF88 family protein